jgi:hypothetical protein
MQKLEYDAVVARTRAGIPFVEASRSWLAVGEYRKRRLTVALRKS